MSKKRTHTPRRTWTGPEEEQLLLGLKECVANGLKCDNGFRTGYLAALEQHLNNQFPGTDLKADPHILSKIHVWKKQFATLSTMMGMSGFGWNDRTCQIVVDSDQVWEAYVKTDAFSKSMRHKHWLFYQDWTTIFGKDRANGEERTCVADAMYEIRQKDKGKTPVSPAMAASNREDSPSAPYQSDADSTMLPRSRGETVTSPNKSGRAGKKRARMQDGVETDVVNLMGKFFNDISTHMGEIKENLGTEREAIEMRRKVIDAIKPIESLSDPEKFQVIGRVCEKAKDVDLFLRIDDDQKYLLARMILKGEYIT